MERRSKARQKIREERQKKTQAKDTATKKQQIESVAKERKEEIAEQRQRETRTTKNLSRQHKHY